jgi:Leucine-rich repeat (LRR) protein
LQWLDLTSNKVTDAGLEQLMSLTGLKHLTTQGKQITTIGQRQLRQGLPHLTPDWELP